MVLKSSKKTIVDFGGVDDSCHQPSIKSVDTSKK